MQNESKGLTNGDLIFILIVRNAPMDVSSVNIL